MRRLRQRHIGIITTTTECSLHPDSDEGQENARTETIHNVSRAARRWGTFALSAVVPWLFWWRTSIIAARSTVTNITRHNNSKVDDLTTTYNTTNSNASSILSDYWTTMMYYSRTNASSSSWSFVEWPEYCSTESLNETQFWEQAGPVLHKTLLEYQHEYHTLLLQQSRDEIPRIDSTSVIFNEFLGQLLEQYLQRLGDDDDDDDNPRACNYSNYRPTVPSHAIESLATFQPTGSSSLSCRIVAILSAFYDAPHVVTMLQALQHDAICLVVHVDDKVDPTFRATIQAALLETQPQQSILLQFGSVVYRTDSLSLLNVRILQWLSSNTNVNYEYVMLLDGSAYPLVSATELVQRLLYNNNDTTTSIHSQRRHVWLGALTHHGVNVTGRMDAQIRWQRQRLLDPVTKWHRRLPPLSRRQDLPARLRRHLHYKSTSGNQAIYSRTVVQALLNSDTVMELFARAKFGCCCCIEEHSWIAALSMIGYADEALQHEPFMFQSWGGSNSDGKCVGSMNNAVLSRNDSLCFRTEDPLANELYYGGNETWDRLRAARTRGVLMARKFRSDRPDSVQLRDDIRDVLWDSGWGVL